MDLPNLIPEDWLGADTKSNESTPVQTKSDSQPQANTQRVPRKETSSNAEESLMSDRSPSHKVNGDASYQQSAPKSEPVGQKWEEVTQAFIPSSQITDKTQQPASETKVGFVSNTSFDGAGSETHNDISQAFYEG